MASRMRQVALALLSALCIAHAVNITVPDEVKAGESTEVVIGYDTWKPPYSWKPLPEYTFGPQKPECKHPDPPGCSWDVMQDNIQLYLWTEEYLFFCYITDIMPVGTTKTNITIPANLGPDQDYQLTAMEFNGTKSYTEAEGMNQSNTFRLTGSNRSDWDEWEEYAGYVKPWATLPCHSYDCWRSCGIQHRPSSNQTSSQAAVQALFDCWNDCPGIVADPRTSFWDWYCTGIEQCQSIRAPSATTQTTSAARPVQTTTTQKPTEKASKDSGADRPWAPSCTVVMGWAVLVLATVATW